MKKIILVLGFSMTVTASPVLAENFMDQSYLPFEETRTTYIKPVFKYGMYPAESSHVMLVNSDLLTTQFSTGSLLIGPFLILDQLPQERLLASHYTDDIDFNIKHKVDHVLFAGVDIGIDINDYFGIAGEIGYHNLQSSLYVDTIFTKIRTDGQPITLPEKTGTSLSLSAISFMLKPIVTLIRSEDYSIYLTGGIGVSYNMLNMNIKDTKDSIFDKFKQSGEKHKNIKKELTTRLKEKTNVFRITWMLGIGCTMDINDYTELDIVYSYGSLGYLQTSKILSNGTKDGDIKAEDINASHHSLSCGVRFYL